MAEPRYCLCGRTGIIECTHYFVATCRIWRDEKSGYFKFVPWRAWVGSGVFRVIYPMLLGYQQTLAARLSRIVRKNEMPRDKKSQPGYIILFSNVFYTERNKQQISLNSIIVNLSILYVLKRF